MSGRVNLDSFMPKPLIDKEIIKKEDPTPADLISGFGKVLKSNFNKVNNLQKEANILAMKLATGEVENIHDVMIAGQKAELALNLMMEIRNRAMRAYQEIMTMR